MPIQRVKLTEFDVIPYHQATIKSISIYKGATPVDYLRTQCTEIVKSNRWLLSKLHINGLDDYELVYDSDCSTDWLYTHHVDHTISSRLNYSDMISKLAPYITVKPGFGNDEVMIQVSTIEIADGHFVLLFGLSHVFGDVYTKFSIYNMLSSNAEVIALDPTRIEGYEAAKDELFKNIPNPYDCVPKSWRDGLLNKSRSSNPPPSTGQLMQVKTFTVNVERVEQLKKDDQLKGDAKFITTNDILCHWFFTKVGKEGFSLAMSNRSKIDFIPKHSVGNYVFGALLGLKDIETPGSFHIAITNLKSAASGIKTCASYMTNWCKYSCIVDLPNAEHVAFYPVQLPIQSDVSFMKVYQKSKDQIGLFICGEPSITSDDLVTEEQ